MTLVVGIPIQRVPKNLSKLTCDNYFALNCFIKVFTCDMWYWGLDLGSCQIHKDDVWNIQ